MRIVRDVAELVGASGCGEGEEQGEGGAQGVEFHLGF
jgi:hypothetical protein